MLLANVGTKALSLGAQVCLGYLLVPAAFGQYAVVAGLVAICQAFRDGGVRDHLIRARVRPGTDAADQALAGSIMSNVALMCVLCSAAVPLAELFGEVGLDTLVLVAAAAFPLGSHWGVAVGLLQSQFRFDAAAHIYLLSAGLQFASSVALASLWPSPMALVLPLPLAAAVSSILARSSAGLRLLPRRCSWGPGLGLVWRTRWLIAGALGAAIFTSGDYLGLGLAWSSALLGVYYFGYQIPAQVGAVAASVGQVLLASLSSAESALARRALVVRTVQALGYVSSACCFVLVLALPALEKLVWHGRWAAAVPVAQAVALFLPIRLLYVVSKSIRLAASAYRRWTLEVACAGGGLVVTGFVAGSFTERVALVGCIVGAYLALTAFILVLSALSSAGLTVWLGVRSVFQPYAVCVAAAVVPYLVTVWLEHRVHGPMLPITSIAVVVLYLLLVAGAARLFHPQLSVELWARLRRRIANTIPTR